ncbi:MAG: hypothetical protein E3J71_04655 [Candidatus Stahlbacteria bacterium]|nr:MAG: hypothetical protein E3J71_04655 [Candidatus Stahlbacteria bacterium]
MFRTLALKGMVVSLLLGGFGTPLLAEQGIGMQADFLGQGLAYRLLSEKGFGFEIVARGRFDNPQTGSSTYHMAGALRILKIVNPDNRFRIYLGAGVGAWYVKGWFEDWDDYEYEDYWDWWSLETKWGLSTAFIVGADWLLFKMGKDRWLSVTPELQAGFYSRPSRSYYGRDYYNEPYFFASPGVGIGLRYVW